MSTKEPFIINLAFYDLLKEILATVEMIRVRQDYLGKQIEIVLRHKRDEVTK